MCLPQLNDGISLSTILTVVSPILSGLAERIILLILIYDTAAAITETRHPTA